MPSAVKLVWKSIKIIGKLSNKKSFRRDFTLNSMLLSLGKLRNGNCFSRGFTLKSMLRSLGLVSAVAIILASLNFDGLIVSESENKFDFTRAYSELDAQPQSAPELSSSEQSVLSFKAVKEWTFMVYMCADNDLEAAGIDDFNEMEYAGSTADINIIVEFDRHPNYDTSNGDWSTTRRYYVTTDPGGYNSAIQSDLIADLGELNLGDPQVLMDFAKWGIDNYPAKKYCLVLWDHGTGWKNVCQDWTNNDRILMPELKTALKAVRDYLGRPLDIVTYDACLMGQFDVYYQTKAYCQLQIGHEEVTGSDGLPYNTILADLKATPTMTSEQLGSTIVTRYSEAYSATGHATVSVCNMSTFDYELAEAVNIFAQKLRHKTSSYNPQVRKAWETAENYSSSYFPDGDEYLDLANFSARIKSYIADIEIQSAAQAVINRVKKMVIYEWHGTGNPGSNGITIYFPEDVYPLDALENHFPIETNWDEFLKSYYDNVSYPNLEPSSNITYPKNNAVFAQPTVVRIKGNASDDIKVETAQVKIDREDWINATSVVEWYWDWNVSNLSLGEHKIWSRAFDGLDYSNYKNITVNITSVAKNDTGVKSINHPLNNTTYEPSTITVNATVINLGELAQNNFNVSCEIKEFGSNLSFYEFDFETGAQNWTHNGTYDNWQNGTPTVGPSSAHSGANCWGTNLTGNYANLQDSNLTSPPLDLTNALNATLEFWMYLDVEDVTGNWDGGIITISPDNGTTWTQLDPSNSQGQYNAQLATGYQNPLAGKWAFCYDTSTWVQKKFNITDYIGKIIKIAFRFGSDNANTAPGWYVDDIAIKMVIPRPEITVYKNITLVTTALVQNATLNLTWNYSFVNETEYRIIVTTLLENDERPHNDYQNIVITIKVYSFTTLLQLGWNFIALPCVNASITKASELATAIGGNCTHVANWTGAEFKIYDRKTGSNDFVLQKGIGYNVYIVNGTTEFTLKGSKIANATVSLSKGWNSVALFNSTLKKASELANAIGDCSAIAHWNITLGRFVTYAVDEQLGDFQLELGKGYFVFMKISKDWTQYS